MWQNQIQYLYKWRRMLFGARTRVITSYVVLVVFSTLVSFVTIRHILIAHLEARIENSLFQEVEEFRRLMNEHKLKTNQPLEDNVTVLFDVFLERNVPNDDEYLIAIIDGKVYKLSHTAIPASLHPTQSELIKVWAEITQPKRGETITPDGNILYVAEPVRIRGTTRGVFVVAHIPDSEYGEVNFAVTIAGTVEAIMAIIALTSSIAWLAAGRILTRLRLLSETARKISEYDLTQRIPVQGSDEITELTITFNEMLERLQHSFSNQRDFMNDAGHELRTPIAIIRCYLEQLRAESPQQPEMLALAFDELERMSRLVDELLLLAKAEHPNFLNLEIVEISSLTEELYVKASTLANRNWRLESKGSGRIIVDRQRLTQAVMNLVQNAIRHTTERDTIALGSILTNDQFRLWVSDTGEGIPLAEQKRIFQRFVRGNSHRRSEGSGLGLAIVKAITEAHGGWVELISQLGSGSTFIMIISV